MIQKYSTPMVNPTNWESPKCSLKKDWYIHYRIYTDQGSKLRIVKGMNHLKTWEQRYTRTKELLQKELSKLQKPVEAPVVVPPPAPVAHFKTFKEGLENMLSRKRKSCVKRHCDNIETLLERFMDTAEREGIQLSFGEVTRQSCLLILDSIEKYYPCSDKTYNRYVKDIGNLFEMLNYYEFIKYNPFTKIVKKVVEVEARRVASPAERKRIDKYLYKQHYCFWRFMHIFFSSGAREIELCRMETADIHLKERIFKVWVYKGRSKRQEIKPILPEAYRHWAEVVAAAKKHPFGPNFEPGDRPVNVDQVSKTWKRLVKNELELGHIDFYSLKHLHTDLIAENHGIELAQQLDDHKDVKTTGIYAVGEKTRHLNRLKQINIKFSN